MVQRREVYEISEDADMTGGGRWFVVVLSISATTFILCGCNDARIRTRMAHRDESIRDVFLAIESFERQRPASIQRVLDAVDQAHRNELDRTPKNFDDLGQGFERDAGRYRSRLPTYKAGIQQIFNGHPDGAFDPLLILF